MAGIFPRFVLDAHLGGLAARLRMLGFDTLWENDFGDDRLVLISMRESRVLLTRDRGLLDRAHPDLVHRVVAIKTHDQLREVSLRFSLTEVMRPFTRCMKCNTRLIMASKAEVRDRIPSSILSVFDEFFECPGCSRVYWKGSHYDRMLEVIQDLSAA